MHLLGGAQLALVRAGFGRGGHGAGPFHLLAGDRRHGHQHVQVFLTEAALRVGGVQIQNTQRRARWPHQRRANHRQRALLEDRRVGVALLGRAFVHQDRFGGRHHVQRRLATDRSERDAVPCLALPMLDGPWHEMPIGPFGQQRVAPHRLRKHLEQAVQNLGQDLIDLQFAFQIDRDLQSRAKPRLRARIGWRLSAARVRQHGAGRRLTLLGPLFRQGLFVRAAGVGAAGVFQCRADFGGRGVVKNRHHFINVDAVLVLDQRAAFQPATV